MLLFRFNLMLVEPTSDAVSIQLALGPDRCHISPTNDLRDLDLIHVCMVLVIFVLDVISESFYVEVSQLFRHENVLLIKPLTFFVSIVQFHSPAKHVR